MSLDVCPRESDKNVRMDIMLRAAPDVIVIGFPKTGTSWLFQMLRQHPQLHVPYPRNDPEGGKEFNTWSAWAEGREIPGLSPEEYAASFEGEGTKCEVSTNYCYSLECLELIRHHLPNVRFILGLRQPIDAVLSDYYHRIRGTTFIPFDQWLADHTDDIRYRFNFDRVLDVDAFVYFFEDLVADPQAILRQMFDFIGVSPFRPPAAELKFNYRYNWRWHTAHVAILEILSQIHGIGAARRMVASPHLRPGWVDGLLRLNERKIDYSRHPGRAEIRAVIEPITSRTVERYRLDWFK